MRPAGRGGARNLRRRAVPSGAGVRRAGPPAESDDADLRLLLLGRILEADPSADRRRGQAGFGRLRLAGRPGAEPLAVARPIIHVGFTESGLARSAVPLMIARARSASTC